MPLRTDAHNPPLLTTKLHIPPVRPELILRPRLIDRLNEDVRRKLTLIAAPAGFGKTTLLSEWIQAGVGSREYGVGKQHEPAGEPPSTPYSLLPTPSPAWLSLDEDDNDPARFFTYLIAALETVQADAGADAQALLRSPRQPPLKTVLTRLINGLAALPNDVVLILDDYHVIHRQSIHDALAFLIDHLPPRLHLIISTRADPPLPLARMRARGHLAEIRAADLRFTPDEAAAFLNDVMGLDLSAEDVAALDARTEGWIAGLHLAALSMRGLAPPRGLATPRGLAAPLGRAEPRSPAARRVSDFIAAFSGSNRHVIDYLAEEVLAQQPEEIRDFLLHTSILDRLTAPLCDTVLGIGKSANQQIGKSTNQRSSKSADEQVDEPANQRLATEGCTESANQRAGDRQREAALSQRTYEHSTNAPVADLQICRFADLQFADFSSRETLHHLEESNLFVVPLDHHRRWYRYHRLFADFLRNRLDQDLPGRVPELHRRAAGWYERNGLPTEAVMHAARAADFEWVARLIEQVTPAVLMRGQLATLLTWWEMLPKALIRSRPRLCVSYVAALLVAGELDTAQAYLQHVEREWPLGLPTTENGNLAAQITAIRAYITVLQGNVDGAIELARQASEHLSEDDVFLRSVVNWLLGMSLYFGRDPATANRTIAESLEFNLASGNTFMVQMTVFLSGFLHIVQGRLHQAEDLFRQGLAYAEADDPPSGASRSEIRSDEIYPPDAVHPPPPTSLVYHGLGEIHRQRNELEDADRYLAESVRLAEKWGNAEVLVDAYVTLARIRQAQGDAQGARDAIGKVLQIERENSLSPLTIHQIAAYHARLQLMQGNLQAAARWAASQEGPHDEGEEGGNRLISLYVRAIEVSTLSRVLIAQGKFAAAIEIIAPPLEALDRAGWTGSVIELLVLQALALQGRGETADALTALQRALRLAEPEGYVRVFIDAGQPLARLLRQAPSQGIKPAYRNQLLAAFDRECSRFQVSGSRSTVVPNSNLKRETLKPETLLLESLTDRELEVLRLVAAGLSNREIADRLTIAVGTAKRHVSNIYAKLDVHSRTRAVARARELRLL